MSGDTRNADQICADLHRMGIQASPERSRIRISTTEARKLMRLLSRIDDGREDA